MTALTKEKVAALHKDLAKAMSDVAAKHGFTFADARMTYYPDSGTVKWGGTQFGLKAMTGDTNPLYMQDLTKYGRFYNLDKSVIGKTITGRTGPEEIIGMKSRNWVITKTVDGKMWKKDPLVVAQLLGTLTSQQALVAKALS